MVISISKWKKLCSTALILKWSLTSVVEQINEALLLGVLYSNNLHLILTLIFFLRQFNADLIGVLAFFEDLEIQGLSSKQLSSVFEAIIL